MASFDIAIEKILVNEGGYANDPSDPGGETNFGISKRAYPSVDIKGLTKDSAKALYRRDYWQFDGCVDQAVATKLLDMSVNMGQRKAIQLLQIGLNKRWKFRLDEDGHWGPATQKAANECDEEDLMNELRAQSVFNYVEVTRVKPATLKFLYTWIRRGVQ